MEDALDTQMDETQHWKSVPETIDNGYKFEFEKYFQFGLKLWGKDAGNSILYTLLAGIILLFSSFTVIGLILLPAPLAAGYFIAADKVNRQGYASLSDYFGGFKYFSRLTGYTAVVMVICMIMYLPFFLLIWEEIPLLEIASNPESFNEAQIFGFFFAILGATLVLTLFTTLVGAFLLCIWIFVIPLIVLGNHPTSDALKYSYRIVLKHFWWFLLLAVLLYTLSNIGAYAMFVGLLATIPMAAFVKYGAYFSILGAGTSEEDELQNSI